MASLVEQVFAVVVGTEGTLSTNRDDRGNWTSGQVGVGDLKGSKYGVSAMAYPDLDIQSLTLETAQHIFERDYFNKIGCDKLPGALAVLVADAAYNNGPSRAAKWLQQAVGVKQDGIIGPATLAAVNARQLADVIAEYQARRALFMLTLPTVGTFGLGWSRRLVHVTLACMAFEDRPVKPPAPTVPTDPAPRLNPADIEAIEVAMRKVLEDRALTAALNQRPAQ